MILIALMCFQIQTPLIRDDYKRLKNANLFQNVDSAAFSFKVTVSDFGD